MAVLRKFTVVFSLILVPQLTVVTVQDPQAFAATIGVDIMLPCRKVEKTWDQCDGVTWTFARSVRTTMLFEHGQIHPDARAESDRLSLTGTCSLELKKVTSKDAGLYTCIWFNTAQTAGGAAVYDLTVHPRGNMRSVRIEPTTRRKSTSTTTSPETETIMSTTENTRASPDNNVPTKQQVWWRFIVVASMAVFIPVMAVICWRKTKGTTTQVDRNGLTSNPAETQSAPETSPDTADPKDEGFYASIRHIRNSNTKEKDLTGEDDDDEGDAVTYSTVKVSSSSSAAASSDPSDLYATINKRNQ
ncbi:uncharacterized protein LOC113137312 isoform X2 [Mastacembelus armatus]|uniref:uncharacterized protein LOC113137312 isoform X2 n=1 Tax=Mastacembelus armatus TaxID=205130 RepID=UPI000E455E74|nr:uncharacterized protein LOC113137312 isoform X2 [Mastacembelus armatus]